MDNRTAKGMEIAATMPVRRDAQGWIVPSQSGHGTYRVAPHRTPYEAATAKVFGGETLPQHVHSFGCTCPDFELRNQPCKHILAVQYVIRRESVQLDGSVVTEEIKVKVTYAQDWASYNAAQCEEKERFMELLSDLCSALPVPTERRVGRPSIPLSVQAFAATFKVFSRFSSRRFTSDMRDAHAKGLVPLAPHFNSISNALSNPALTPVLQHLITLSAMPLKAVETDFAVDSTGFSTSRFARWYDHKWGKEQKKQEWIKLHAMVGVRTNVVTSAEVSGWTVHDTNYFRPLVQQTAENFTMAQVSADKAYLSHANVDFVEKFGATPFIPFKTNSVAPQPSLMPGGWERMWHMFAYQREAFLADYHKRSNVETTFSMIKAKFGDALLSKSDVGQMNEALCKVLAHNICCVISAMHELGVEPMFAERALPA